MQTDDSAESCGTVLVLNFEEEQSSVKFLK